MKFRVPEEEPVFTSGVVSRLLNIPVWVLKQLDSEEIVCPKREEGCSRLYSHQELQRLHQVWLMMQTKQIKVKNLKIFLEMQERIEFLEGQGDESEK